MANPWSSLGSIDKLNSQGHRNFISKSFKLVVLIVAGLTSILIIIGFINLLEGNRRSNNFRNHQVQKSHQLSNVCQRGFNFRFIIPTNNNQVASLKSLIRQLERVKFHDCRAIMEFIRVGDSSQELVNFIEGLNWPHGSVYTHSWQLNATAEAQFASWHPLNDEFGIFINLEEASYIPKDFMTRILWLVERYFIDEDDETRPRRDTMAATRLLGINLKPYQESPSKIDVMSTAASITTATTKRVEKTNVNGMVLTQRIESGVALFAPWAFKKFLHYAGWQMARADNNGNLKTDWRELINDYLKHTGSLFLHFTRNAPLSKGYRLGRLSELPPLETIPIFNNRQEYQKSIMSLELMPSGYPGYPLGGRSKRCILDEMNNAIVTGPPGRNRYLFYEPVGSVPQQVSSVQVALIFANLLNRTLIIPPLVNPRNQSDWMAFRSIFLVNFNWLQLATFETFQFFAHPIQRAVLYQQPTQSNANAIKMPISAPLRDFNIPITGPTILLPALNLTDQQLVDQYGGCQDDILFFRHFNQILSHITIPSAQDNLLRLQSMWGFRPQIRWFLERLKKRKWPGSIACVLYSRGDRGCGSVVLPDAPVNQTQALIDYRSCKASPLRTLEYAQDLIRQSGLNTTAFSSIYLMQETMLTDEELNSLPRLVFENNTSVVTARDIAKWMPSDVTLDISQDNSLFAALLVERELCRRASFFVNNLYSSLGNLLVKAREVEGLPNAFLGQPNLITSPVDESSLNATVP